MSCFSCIPPPASLKPRKIYNILVPDVFPLKAPSDDEPVPHGIQRKIGKLQEYVQRNPDKASKVAVQPTQCSVFRPRCQPCFVPQVSRRLTRKIKWALYEQQIGYVRIAVAAYSQLLDMSTEEDSSYSLNYFSKELIHQPDAMVSFSMRDAWDGAITPCKL